MVMVVETAAEVGGLLVAEAWAWADNGAYHAVWEAPWLECRGEGVFIGRSKSYKQSCGIGGTCQGQTSTSVRRCGSSPHQP